MAYQRKLGVHGVGAVFFVFQAEDGIRDLHVTGVQTCALPISLHAHTEALRQVVVADELVLSKNDLVDSGTLAEQVARLNPGAGLTLSSADAPPSRSEERRVGKECWGRWSMLL